MRKPYQVRMRELREDRDLAQKETAAVLGITQQTYALYEIGERDLPIRHLIALIKYYKVSADYFLGLTNEASRAASINFKPGRDTNDLNCCRKG